MPVVHVADEVTTSVLPSVYVPVAASGKVVPSANDALAGVTASDTSTACPTFKVAVAVIEPDVAVIVALPTPAPVATPPATIVATPVADELQLTDPVRFCVLPSLYVPVAVNCSVVPFAIETLPGVTDNEVNTAAVTVNVADPLIAPDVALIVAVPCATPVASPPLLTVATEVADELHVAVLVKFCCVPLL